MDFDTVSFMYQLNLKGYSDSVGIELPLRNTKK